MNSDYANNNNKNDDDNNNNVVDVDNYEGLTNIGSIVRDISGVMSVAFVAVVVVVVFIRLSCSG